MKLYRTDPNDVADMVNIWAGTGFSTAAEAVEAFYAAFAHAPDDPHLDDLIVQIAAQAGHHIPRR